MRKSRKRLALNRETLVELDRSDMQAANGATTEYSTCYGCASFTCRPPCQYSNRNTCTTCQMTCTTNFC
ncbi:MAG TPA: hypothetical protein VKY89_20915 [Thermoanaerobaculia bacterium]|jgi:hypothetical protein|nr:hypothetical protein [Thermoanaerobaculia bacterium]